MSNKARIVVYSAAIASIFGLILILVHEPIKTTISLIVVIVLSLIFSIASAIDLVQSLNKSRQKAATLIETLQRSITSQYASTGMPTTDSRWDESIASFPWEPHHTDYCLEYMDLTGSKVSYKKTQMILPRVDLSEIKDVNIRADGSFDLDSFYSVPGEVISDEADIEKHKVGTMITVRTPLDPPQRAGKEFGREFGYVMLDSFTKEEETYGIHVSHILKSFTFSLKVPAPLHLSHVTSEAQFGAYIRESNSQPQLSEDNRQFTFAVQSPLLGERYVLHWKVHGLTKAKD